MSQSNQASSSKKSNVISKNYISKNEILAWINDLLKVNMTLIEQLGSGTMYCQILDVIYPGQVPLSKVKWSAKLEYDFLHNFKILQQTFDKLQVPKMIPVNKLSKAKYQDNLEFAQWMKAYFDVNCKEKGRGYDALKRRGNVVPYFGFCKGGVLPKQTLFFRNPNEKLNLDDFSSSSFSSQHEPEFPENESYSSNNNVQGLFKSDSTPRKQSSFFSNNSPQSNSGSAYKIKQQLNLTQKSASFSQASNSFFQRGEKQQSITPKNSFFETSNNSTKEFSQSFGKNEGQKIQENTCSFFQKDNQYKEQQSQNSFSTFKQGNQGSNFFNSDQNSQNSNSIIENSFFNKQRGQNSNQSSNQNNFFNVSNEQVLEQNINYSNKFSCDKSYEKKTPSLSTSNLLSKIQQLTEVSQILLKKNSETSEKSNQDVFQKQQLQTQSFEDQSPQNLNQQNINAVKQNQQDDQFFTKNQNNYVQNQIQEINFQNQFSKNNFEQNSQNNYLINNENSQSIQVHSKQINKLSVVQNNNLSQQSDSQGSNILCGNVFSQDSAPCQQFESNQDKELQINISKNQENTLEIENSPNLKQNEIKMNQIQNNYDEIDEPNSYETPICKKQKKNSESQNFSKDSEKYNQTTVQITNREYSNQKQENEKDQSTNSSNKDKILQIFSIIQLSQQDYDSAMQQILNVLKI